MKEQIYVNSFDSKSPRGLHRLELILERALWNWRFIILLAAFGFLFISAITFVMGTLEAVVLVQQFISQVIHHGAHFSTTVYNEILTTLIAVIDHYLLAIVLLIFGLGIYQLFISRLNLAEEQHDIRVDWLVFHSMHELKAVLAKVILMIIIVNFLKNAIDVHYTSPLDILYLGGAIASVGLAIKLSYGEDLEHYAHQKNETRNSNA